MIDSPIKTGLMAYGMSGRIFHAPFLTASACFELKAVVERHEKKAAEKYPQITSYNTVGKLLDDDDIELIIINTPNNTHFNFAIQALRAGKHVLIEKPIASSIDEVKILYDLGREMNRHVMVYQNRRWDSDFLAVRKVIESGRLGQLIEVHFRFDRYKSTLSPKLFKELKASAPNGLVYDLGPHLVDQAISLFGRPLSFHKITAIHREGSQVIDYFNYHLIYPNKLNVYLTSGLLIAEPQAAFVIHGTLGSFIKKRCDLQEAQLDQSIKPTEPEYGLEPQGCDGRLVVMALGDEKCTEVVASIKGDYAHLFKAVYQTIRNNALYPITEEHIAWQIELLEANDQ